MKLELANFPVKDIRFGRQTSYKNGVLEINKEYLLKLVREDSRIAWADLDVAFPNEHVRIVNIHDVIEPRIKVSGPGCVFPGILGPVETVGEGRTHRLSGAAVIVSGDYLQTVTTGSGTKDSTVLDMWGPGALITPLASAIKIVLILKLIDGVSELEAHTAIQLAEFKVGRRLAETTRELTPEDVEVFELSEADPTLPRIVYIIGALATVHNPHTGIEYYGWQMQESLATFVHPNEFLDGAVTTDARRSPGHNPSTWAWMNNLVILRLLREHGKRLNFLGVILQRTRFEKEFGKQIAAACSSQMARLLRADGALLTGNACSGNNFMDVMLTVQACERKGVKTVLVTPEWGGKEGTELPLLFYVPEATAIVSTCSMDSVVELSAPARVIGIIDNQPVFLNMVEISPSNEMALEIRESADSVDWFGCMNRTCEVY